MIAVLHQHQLHVLTGELFGDAHRRFPRHIRVLLAVQQAHRTIDRDRVVQQQMLAAILDQRAGDLIGAAVFTGNIDVAVLHQPGAFLEGHRLPHQRLGEVGRGGDADQGRDALRAGEGGEQRQPAAHRGADQDQRSVALVVDHADGIGGPAADGAVLENAAAGAVSGIVELQHRLAARGTVFGERGCLVAGHVAAEAGQKDHGWAASILASPGEFHAVAAIEPSGGYHLSLLSNGCVMP